MSKYTPLVFTGIAIVLGGLAYLAIDHYGLDALIALVGVAGIAGIIFAESGLLIGFFLPGDSLLFTAGFLVQQDILKFDINLLAALLFFAAALGDNVGYAFGNRVGPKLFKRKDSLLFHHENLQRAENFYERYGGRAIILARFVPVVRTFAPIVAGIGKMQYKSFVAYNLIGAFFWAVGLTYLGYFAGGVIERSGINIEYVILGIIALSVLPPIIHVLREPEAKKYFQKELKRFRQR